MTTMSTFSYEELRKFLVDRLELVKTRLRKASEEDIKLLSYEAVYVFLRLTCFLVDSGYSELAVAAWQAMLEMTFARPISTDESEPMLSSLGDFWESEVPRIGEDGAKGWKDFAEAETLEEAPDPKRDRPAGPLETRDHYKAWAATEKERARASRLPARTLDEGVDNDPFRVVMFSDVKDMLIWLPSCVLPHISSLVQDAFLLFCGLPPVSGNSEQISSLIADPFIFEWEGALTMASTGGPIPSGDSANLSIKYPSFTANGSRMAMSPDTLFSGRDWFNYIPRRPDPDARVDLAWAIAAIRHIVRVCGAEELAEYYLALEWVNSSVGARKVSKALLKQYPSNIRLYNAYALIERANDNLDISRKVLASATSQRLVSCFIATQQLSLSD